MPTITVIVTTYNRCAYLAEAITALEAQTRAPAQIILRDDGSTDGTEAYARPLADRSSGRILYRRGENRGKSHALNEGLAEATGDYIWICDDDDLVLPDAAERLGAALDRTEAGMAAGMHERFEDDPVTGERRFSGPGYWPDLSEGSVLRHLLEDIFFFQNATLVRQEAFARVGPFREDLMRSIDYEMFVRLAARHPVEMVEGVLFHQRKHPGARGPAAARHEVAASEAVWSENDRAIFARFRDLLPLELYEAMFETPDPALRRRAALLQRGCVYARRNDWEAALDDLKAAAAVAGGGAEGNEGRETLTAVERAICHRTMAGKHGAAAAFRAPVAGQLAELGGRAGRAISTELARGAVWRAREAAARRDLPGAARVAAFVMRLGWPPSAPAKSGARLIEKRQLTPNDYAW
jgi:glycosyltransferase involved in cell wall biosynthesis